MKTALNRIRDVCLSRQRELNEEMLVLQERMDSLNHSLTERTEENATLNTQASHMRSFSSPAMLNKAPQEARSLTLRDVLFAHYSDLSLLYCTIVHLQER